MLARHPQQPSSDAPRMVVVLVVCLYLKDLDYHRFFRRISLDPQNFFYPLSLGFYICRVWDRVVSLSLSLVCAGFLFLPKAGGV